MSSCCTFVHILIFAALRAMRVEKVDYCSNQNIGKTKCSLSSPSFTTGDTGPIFMVSTTAVLIVKGEHVKAEPRTLLLSDCSPCILGIH